MKKITTVILFFTLYWSQITHAADITVGSGKTHATIAAAIAAAADGDRIVIDAGTYTEFLLNPGDKSLAFVGNSGNGGGASATVIQGNTTSSATTNAGSVFSMTTAITAPRSYTFEDVTVKWGYASAGNGGGFNVSTGTANTLTLSLTRCAIVSNRTNATSGLGAGLYLGGKVSATLTDCEIGSNLTRTGNVSAGGSGICIGAIGTTCPIVLNRCYVHDNQSARGGGAGLLFMSANTTTPVDITIKNSTFKTNSLNYTGATGAAYAKGAGICVFAGNSGSTTVNHKLWIENSTLTDNTSNGIDACGNGVFFSSWTSTGTTNNTQTVTINNSTIYNNRGTSATSTSVGGEGVCISSAGKYGTKLIMNNSIVIGNTAAAGSNTSQVGSNVAAASQTTYISAVGASGSQLYNNIFGNAGIIGGWITDNNTATYDFHNNINSSTTSTNLAFGSISSDATPVLPIGQTSIARNYVVTNYLSPALSADQINQSRVYKTDAGAYESQSPVYQVSLTAGENGTVSAPTGGFGDGYYDYYNGGSNNGASATITATPNPTYEFDKWTDDGGTTISIDNPYTFNVTANTSLTANFKVSAVPTIAVTPSTLSGFGYAPGSGPSSEKTFSISGLNLTNDISITPPSNYEISTTTGGSFSATNPIVIDKGSGTVTSTTIYARLKAGLSAATAYNSENITLTSDGAVSKTVSCSGNVYAAAPTTAATAAVASNVLHTTATLSWTAGDADKYLVVYSTNSDVATAHLPVGGTTYTAGQTLASGYTIGYAGTGTTANITGLTAGTTMYFAVFGYNDKYSGVSTSGYENYLTTSPATTSTTTIVASNASDYFRSRATGTWATATTWESSVNGTDNWHIASAAPTSLATSVSVQDGYTVTVDAATTIPATTVDATSTLKATAAITAGSTLVVNGTYEHAIIPAAIQTPITTPVTTWSVGSTLLISTQYPSTIGGSAVVANNQVNSLGGTGYQNVTFNVNIPVTDAFLSVSATINGKLKVIATGNGGILSTALVSVGSYEQTGGIVICNRNSSSLRGFAVQGDATISGGTLNVRYNYNNGNLAGPANFNVGGNLTISGGTITNGASGSNSPSTTLPIIEFTKNGTQTYTNSGVAFTNGIAILVGATSTLDMGASTFAGTGSQASTFSTASGATLLIANASGVNAYFGSNITPTFSNAKLVYNGSEAQVTGSLATSINNLEVSNTSGVSLSANTTTASLLINSGSILTVPAANQLTVSTTMTNNGTLNLNSGIGGTATILTPVTISGSGTANVNQYLTYRTWYMSSPVASSSPTGMSVIKYYDEPNNLWPVVTNPVTTPLTKGIGYFITPVDDEDESILFSGTLNSGPQTITLTRRAESNVDYSGFNLIGNPYPAFLDWTAVCNYTTDLGVTYPNQAIMPTTTMWYRTKVALVTDPITYEYQFWTVNGLGQVSPATASAYIPPMQAFWVRANSLASDPENPVSLKLTNNMCTHAPAENYLMKVPAVKNSETQRLRLKVSNGISNDEAVVYFNSNATNGFDIYDSPKFAEANTVTQIYTTAGNEKLVINGMSAIPLDTPIGLGFVPGSATSFSIKANEVYNLPSDVKVILKDNANNGFETDLTDGITTYEFTPATTSGDRFSLIFRSPGTVTGIDKADNANINIYANANRQITVAGNETGSLMSVYNTVGQKLLVQKLSNEQITINRTFAPGIYMVTVNNVTKKLVIN